ncbi:hypothetical protein FA09DRAFT_229250 [Tilletiopsis washingtonensis]|uniref:Uncharacterized protein n=1 Tax=Tilletiopsis washingtonensis TaxID=58919 RepID=A0A316ZEA6_9BASI|nr:hypothetical protein FA09DRAFT_229250 [Tilletiopsis washingtonensis]PWN99378.1 hypothetical protein FA09DRAFT_229250 [Tilletiopsis washingtonensis]
MPGPPPPRTPSLVTSRYTHRTPCSSSPSSSRFLALSRALSQRLCHLLPPRAPHPRRPSRPAPPPRLIFRAAPHSSDRRAFSHRPLVIVPLHHHPSRLCSRRSARPLAVCLSLASSKASYR